MSEVKFDPKKDIPDLTGRVILVTGGMLSFAARSDSASYRAYNLHLCSLGTAFLILAISRVSVWKLRH
jgi:hypothetical protein